MLNKDFCDYLEIAICNVFIHLDSPETRGFWCDGVMLDHINETYTLKNLNKKRQVKMIAYIGKDGQTKYNLILKFGSNALNRLTKNLVLNQCIPTDEASKWFSIDTERHQLELQLT